MQNQTKTFTVAVLFGGEKINGKITALNAGVEKLAASSGTVSDSNFKLPNGGRLEISFSNINLKRGAFPSICRVITGENSFSFNLRDVTSGSPVFVPEYRVAVVPASDRRSYGDVAEDVYARGLVSDFARFASMPEESYEAAASLNLKQYCQTWLGLGRDMRMFRAGYQQGMQGELQYGFWGQIQPFYHTVPQHLPDATAPVRNTEAAYQLSFMIGQGSSCRPRMTRRLEDGCLPILRSTQSEQDVDYNLTIFASQEKEPLTPGGVRGSEWQACYAYTSGNMLTTEERDSLSDLIKTELIAREQEVVCCVRIEACNKGRVPRYAWFKAAHVAGLGRRFRFPENERKAFDSGLSMLEKSGKIYAVNRIDGEPLPNEEMAVLLQPGEVVTFDALIPHSPLDMDRAKALLHLDFDAHLTACRRFWRARLDSAAEIHVPEKPICENIKAGLLHCDIAVLGREPDGPALATIGAYSPIGTESAPIIQFFDSMGWHKLAERCIDFFFTRQRPDGFIQNFANYQSETGPLLWTVGEHYRYTRDTQWLKRVLPNIKKASDYLLQWRDKNKVEEYRAKGFYGMVDGKVADPNDFYHSFFLNAGTYIGLKRTEEMLREVDPEYSTMLASELPEYLKDIRAGFYDALARAPVVPMPDGTWAPLVPPWVEHTGGISLYAEGGKWFSHGAFASRSALTGPLWLIIGEILDSGEIGAEFMIKTNQYPVTLENAALSQPYYCRHDFAHIKRGEVASFLKAYYNQLTALHDRETYTFWEHYYHASEHKTHEEAWFLMQTRWMLWLEDGADLRLLSAVPRAWLKNGEHISLKGVKSYFGPVWLDVLSDVEHNKITAEFRIESDNPPTDIVLRLPHPERRKAISCSGGVYDPEMESVRFAGSKVLRKVELLF